MVYECHGSVHLPGQRPDSDSFTPDVASYEALTCTHTHVHTHFEIHPRFHSTTASCHRLVQKVGKGDSLLEPEHQPSFLPPVQHVSVRSLFPQPIGLHSAGRWILSPIASCHLYFLKGIQTSLPPLDVCLYSFPLGRGGPPSVGLTGDRAVRDGLSPTPKRRSSFHLVRSGGSCGSY